MKHLFNAITYTGDTTIGAGGFVKYRKISSVERHVIFIGKKYPGWRWITFYNKVTNEKQIITKKTADSVSGRPFKNEESFFPGSK